MTKQELTLAAEDAEDLEVISARLQDAVTPLKELVYLPKTRRFVALLNRFVWEDKRKNANLRVRSLLYFDDVLSVQAKQIKMGAPDAVVSAACDHGQFTPKGGEDPGGDVELLFAGGGALKLEVECIDAGLTDVGGVWAARGRPDHDET